MKALIKKLFFKLFPQKLPEGKLLNVGCIIHTERIQVSESYEHLLSFAKNYFELTGTKCICTILPGNNPEVVEGLSENGISEKEYVRRVKDLSNYATIGYHGHFWIDPTDFKYPSSQIRCNNFVSESMERQVEKELAWYEEHQIDHNRIYSGGWFFMNESLARLLIKKNFKTDFSFSRYVYFRNKYSTDLMNRHKIKTGQPFVISSEEGELLCIQNLVGFDWIPENTIRNLKKILSPEQIEIFGVLNIHDYDLKEKTEPILDLFKSYAAQPNFKVLGAEELIRATTKKDLYEINLDNSKGFLKKTASIVKTKAILFSSTVFETEIIEQAVAYISIF